MTKYLARKATYSRYKTLLDLPIVRTKIGQSMFKYAGAKHWNLLPKYMKEITSIHCFKQTLFNYLLESDSSDHICSL